MERMGPERPMAGAPGTSFTGPLALLLLGLGFGWLSMLAGSVPADGDAPLARDRFTNVILAGVEEATAAGEDGTDAGTATNASLAKTPRIVERNVVLIHLESTHAQSVTPYDEELETATFLDELAESSLLAERAYVVVPRSSKASVAANCGIEPAFYPGPEFEPGGDPAPCLAGLLK